MGSTTWTTPKDKVWKVWTDIGQEDGHMVGFTSSEEFDKYEHEYNVKTYGENYEELFEQYEAESEAYAWELTKKDMADDSIQEDDSQTFEDIDEFLEAIEKKTSKEKIDEPRWLSDEEIRQAGIEFNNGVDLDSPEEKEKTRLMWEEMQAEEDFMNNLKVKTVLDDGTVLETEFPQLENIC